MNPEELEFKPTISLDPVTGDPGYFDEDGIWEWIPSREKNMLGAYPDACKSCEDNTAIEVDYKEDGISTCVKCGNCGAAGPIGCNSNEAVALWNGKKK